MIYFTSDTHFGHNQPFLYEPRGFTNIQEHDEALIERWNKVVKNEDTVFILGDLILGDNAYGADCLKQLNGAICFTRGNHDTDRRLEVFKDLGLVNVGDAYRLKYKKLHFILCHYPMLTSNFDRPWFKTEIALYGHTHQTSNFSDFAPRAYHVGVDSHNCCPVAIDQVVEDIRAQALNT